MTLTFQKTCEAWKLEAELLGAGLAKGVRFSGVSVSGETTSVHGADDLSGSERDLIGAVVGAHDAASLATAKAARAVLLKLETRAYIEKHYAAPTQRSLILLMDEARGGSTAPLPDRRAYVQTAVDWVDSVVAYHYGKVDELTAAVDLAALMTVTWDFSGTFNASDPLVSIRSAKGITT